MANSCMDQIQPLRDFKTEPRTNRQTIMFSSLDFDVFKICCDVRDSTCALCTHQKKMLERRPFAVVASAYFFPH